MATTMIQYVFKPNPGADLEAIIGLVREAASLWREAGAEPSLWNVQVGEIGNMVFAVRAACAADMGIALDKINANPGSWLGAPGPSRPA